MRDLLGSSALCSRPSTVTISSFTNLSRSFQISFFFSNRDSTSTSSSVPRCLHPSRNALTASWSEALASSGVSPKLDTSNSRHKPTKQSPSAKISALYITLVTSGPRFFSNQLQRYFSLWQFTLAHSTTRHNHGTGSSCAPESRRIRRTAAAATAQGAPRIPRRTGRAPRVRTSPRRATRI